MSVPADGGPAATAGTDTAAIALDNVTVRYGDVLALDRVTLTLPPGRVYALLGSNGSGKSTLFKAVTGMITPQFGGSVLLHGLDPAAARTRGLVGYVPQTEQVDWAFPVRVYDVVMMGRYGHMGRTRRPRAADRAAVDEALERTGLGDLAGRQIGALSGGQRKRAFVARGIAQGARLFLLDEPFAGVDKGSEGTIIEVLRAMRDDGRTLLVSTHDLAGVPAFCDEAVLLQRRVVARGTPAEVLSPELLMEAFGLNEVPAGGPAPGADAGPRSGSSGHPGPVPSPGPNGQPESGPAEASAGCRECGHAADPTAGEVR